MHGLRWIFAQIEKLGAGGRAGNRRYDDIPANRRLQKISGPLPLGNIQPEGEDICQRLKEEMPEHVCLIIHHSTEPPAPTADGFHSTKPSKEKRVPSPKCLTDNKFVGYTEPRSFVGRGGLPADRTVRSSSVRPFCSRENLNKSWDSIQQEKCLLWPEQEFYYSLQRPQRCVSSRWLKLSRRAGRRL